VLHQIYSMVDGLVVLLDTCYSGVAAAGAANEWVNELRGELRFELLTASADRPAADGCFTKTLIGLVRSGLNSVYGDTLDCGAIRGPIATTCLHQQPQLPSYNRDPGLYLARNVARRVREASLAGTSVGAEVDA
jgi:hypothetical protein